ncbi:cation:proton antiporter [Sodalinema gerasimenkoae]|uniref:cation:proton antiporter n=1 Tax=Sodalinema gerasimenkoae TaxID=2862348 RepID=UPI00135C3F4D|nr:cation:proton antiporter [Sodalinema gerasimenkoae]
MTALTIAGITLPLLIGLTIYLLPPLARYLALGVTVISLGYGVQILRNPEVENLQLLDNFGISLQIDSLSGYFILTNALVTLSVLIYSWQQQKSPFFYTQVTILQGSLNAVFISADFISLYVNLEVISITVFLLIAYPLTDRLIWIGLRYLFISNTAMLFYLVGAILVYQSNHSFHFEGLMNSPPEAIALIVLGLLSKGGIFVSGLWSPLTNAESDTSVSVLLSGIVEKAGVFPLIRCALLLEEIQPLVQVFGIATAFFGVSYGLFERDTKRVLAFSTISQLGWIMVAPAVGGIYALAHGLVKSLLFFVVGALPSRDLNELQQKPIASLLWIPLLIGSLSISGCPLWVGFGSKKLTLDQLSLVPNLLMTVAAIGTAVLYARFVFLPHQRQSAPPLSGNLLLVIGLLIFGLLVANILYLPAYSAFNLLKAIAIIVVGWGVHWVFFRKMQWQIPRVGETLDNLLGVMTLVLIVLFWGVLL